MIHRFLGLLGPSFTTNQPRGIEQVTSLQLGFIDLNKMVILDELCPTFFTATILLFYTAFIFILKRIFGCRFIFPHSNYTVTNEQMDTGRRLCK